MRYLTKDQARAPKRDTAPLQLPEFDAPLLVATEASAGVGLRLRERKVAISSDEGISAMVADMVLNPDGSRMFTPDEVPDFFENLSVTSATTLMTACLGTRHSSGGGDPGNSQPSTSAD